MNRCMYCDEWCVGEVCEPCFERVTAAKRAWDAGVAEARKLIIRIDQITGPTCDPDIHDGSWLWQ